MPEITIRRMTMDDVDGVYAVEIGTFVDAWSRDAFVSDMKNPVARYLVAEQDGKIIGYAVRGSSSMRVTSPTSLC